MKVLVVGIKGQPLTGGGTYQTVLLKELALRHEVRLYRGVEDLQEPWDIIHCVDLKQLPVSLALKKNAPLVVDVHDYYWVHYYHFLCLDFPLRFLLQKYRRVKYHYLFRYIDGIILHGKFMYDIVSHPSKYLSSYFGLDYSGITETPWEQKEDLILFVGSDYFRKGLPRLLRALPFVLKRVPSARVMVVGKDYWYAKYFARLLAKGLPVDFLHGLPREEVCRLYGRAKILVLPSEIEALSLVTAEASMAGIPSIVTDRGGMPDVILDNVNGFVVPLEDAKMLADRIVQCLTDRQLSERLASTGKAIFSKYTIQGMMDRLDEIYQDVMRSKSRCPETEQL